MHPRLLTLICVLFLISPFTLVSAQVKTDPSSGLPLYFIENQGQVDQPVDYYLQAQNQTLYFTPQGVTYALTNIDSRWAVKVEFLAANPEVSLEGAVPQEAVFSYFRGEPETWQQGVSTFRKIIYRDLWPGIDLVYTLTENRLKYDFLVSPQADPTQIRLAIRGATQVTVDESSLRIITPNGVINDCAPVAWQNQTSGRKTEVPMNFLLEEAPAEDAYTYSFQVGAYDRSLPLVLDPAILIYSGFIGGLSWDEGYAVAVDQEGHAYIGGSTASRQAHFPVTTGPDLTYNLGSHDAFVAKLDKDGKTLLYCGYLGGADKDHGYGLAVDNQGRAYLAGGTDSDPTSFPVKVGPFLSKQGPLTDAFVARVNAAGTDLDYCGYIGGANVEIANAVAVDAQGRAYVAGQTFSKEDSFPVLLGPDLTFNGPSTQADGFVARVSADGTRLDYCGYIGGEDDETINGLDVDSTGHAYLGGTTSSSETTLPVKVGPDLTFNHMDEEGHDGFVARVSADGTQLDYCGYMGGEGGDFLWDVAVDEVGNLYAAGTTSSTETTFPVKIGPDLTYNGFFIYHLMDGFVAKVNATGTDLDYCGYIGGKYLDVANGIDVDPFGRAFVTGWTNSDEATFPLKEGPGLVHQGQGPDGFVARVDPEGSSLDFCGYIGAKGEVYGRDIAADTWGNAYVTGHAVCQDSSFPVCEGPDLTYNGGGDAYVTQVALSLQTNAIQLSVGTGGSIGFQINGALGNAGRDYLLLGTFSGTEPGTTLPGGAILPLNLDPFTALILRELNTTRFDGFLGTLDAQGGAMAQLNVGKLRPRFIGRSMHFAYLLANPIDYISNPVRIDLVP